MAGKVVISCSRPRQRWRRSVRQRCDSVMTNLHNGLSFSATIIWYFIWPLVKCITVAIARTALSCMGGSYNKSAQSSLGTGPRRGGIAHGAGLCPACVAETRWASVAWRSLMNMAKLKWLSWADRRIWSDDPILTTVTGRCNLADLLQILLI